VNGEDAIDFIHKEEITAQGLSLVSKPISPAALLKKVREMLDMRIRSG